VCGSTMERRRLRPVGKAMPLGAGAGGLLDTRAVGRKFVLVIQPRSGPRII
jgi:hypothetical protein